MDKIDTKLTIDQAYDIMIDYLDKYYEKTKLDDLGCLLGGMMLVVDNVSADPAAVSDWQDSGCKILNQAESEASNKKLTFIEAYAAMIDYLKEYGKRINSEEVNNLVHEWRLSEKNEIINVEAWHEWICSINKVLQEFPDIRPRFILIK